MSHFAVSGRVDELTDGMVGSVDAAMGAAIGPYWKSRLTATYSMMGREKEARVEAAEVLRINPKYSVDYYAKILPYKDQSQKDKLILALRTAGLK